MKGHEGLTSLEGVGQIAHTLLALTQEFHDLEPGLIAQRAEPPCGSL